MRKIDPQTCYAVLGSFFGFATQNVSPGKAGDSRYAFLATIKIKRGEKSMNPHYKYNIDHANKGDNAIATAAYQHRTQLRDESEPDPDKRYKSSNTHSEDIKRERILIPENNPPELYERAEKAKTDKEENDKLIGYLLNKLNKKRANRYTVHGILAHQPEMSDEQNYEAVELFAKRLALDYNCLCIYATHIMQHTQRNTKTEISTAIILRPSSHLRTENFPQKPNEFTLTKTTTCFKK